MNMEKQWYKLFICVFVCLGLGWLGGFITEHSVATWYPTLKKPSGTPPDLAFPIVWTILYAMMGVSLWLIWTARTADKRFAYTVFWIQLFLNVMWSWLFFYLENPLLGLIDILLLWPAILATILAFWKHSKGASLLLVPYLLWVSYALRLNYYIYLYNS